MAEILFVVIPAYNEEANIRRTVKEWHKIVAHIGRDSRLVVIDDGSVDHTWKILTECEKHFSQLVPVHKENGGHGSALVFGYRYAIEHGADYIFQTDADGQTLPEEFWQLWADRKYCGLLIGDRRNRQDGAGRVVVTRILRFVLRIRFGIFVRDANTPFRLMRSEALSEILKLLPENYNLPNVMMSIIYQKRGWGMRWYPITFRPRQGGKNPINACRIIQIGWQAWKEFGLLKGDKKCKTLKL